MSDLVAQLVGALEKLCGTSDDPRNGWRGTGGTDVLFACEYCGAKHEDCTKIEHTNSCPIPTARAALSAAKDGGWQPIEKASDSDKRRCWVLVGESVHLAAYIVIGFEEKRDLDGRYIDQVDHDEYWMDIDSGDPLEPSHFQPLAQPLPNPPKGEV